MTVEIRVLALAVIGSGIAFLDGTIVNVALPAIRNDLSADLRGLQWILDAYLVTLTALLLVGGALGDRYGRRRVFLVGVAGFAAASLLCGAAPSTELLIAARALQGVAGALLIPGSLVLLSAMVPPAQRARWIGAWSGLTGTASAVGPLAGGWLVDTASWRWAFLVNLPLTVVVVVLARGVPESTPAVTPPPLDVAGAVSAGLGLSALAAGLIEAGDGWSVPTAALVLAGLALLVGFWVHEHHSPAPMLPPALFTSRQFTGVNAVTFAVYAGLGVSFLLVVANLQLALGYSAVDAGLALVPVTGCLLVLSPFAGALAQRAGVRLPMTAGALVTAGGLVWLGRVGPGDEYGTAVFPAAVVYGVGLALTIAPLTAAVFAAVEDHRLGVASAANNAIARLAGLLAIAVLPAVAGVDLERVGGGGVAGYVAAMNFAAGLCGIGALVAFTTVRRTQRVSPAVQPSVHHPCLDLTLIRASTGSRNRDRTSAEPRIVQGAPAT